MQKYFFVIFLLLFQSGCERALQYVNDYSPAHMAVSEGNYSKLRDIIEGNKSLVNAETSLGFTPLYLAAMDGQNDMVRYLLEHGANIEVENHLEERPLAKAAKFGHIAVVKTLIDNGAEVNAQDFQGLTALHWAIDTGSLDLIKLLVANGADVTIKSCKHGTGKDRAVELSEVGSDRDKFREIVLFLDKIEQEFANKAIQAIAQKACSPIFQR